VFKETPSKELTRPKANRHARLFSSKQLLNDAIFIRFNDKKLFTLATPKKTHRKIDCMNLLQQRIKTSEKNAFFTLSGGVKQPVEIRLHQCDIRRSGNQA